jgi:hypothetical protein
MTLEERRRRMQEAGIPMPITQVPLSEGGVASVPVTPQNADKHARLQALKSGANRTQVQSLVKAQSAQQGFQPLEAPKVKRRPDPNQGPVQAVSVQDSFGPIAPVSGELAALEAMMGGVASAPTYNPNMDMHSAPMTSQPDLTISEDGYGPAFDPQAMLAKKRQQSAQDYTQYAQPQTAQYAPQQAMQQNFDFQNMQKMMEQIARNTITQVLDSYTERNKEKLTYEHVNVKTNDGTQVIKTQDGQYYKLVPVKVKKN